MRKISFSAKVHAPFEAIWELMLDRIEHPYDPEVREVRIIERQGEFLVREVRARWLLYTDRVTIDKGRREIRYSIEEHPLFFGSAVLRAVPLSRQSPVSPVHLTMELFCTAKNEEAERRVMESMPAEIEQEVLSIKDEAEAGVRLS